MQDDSTPTEDQEVPPLAVRRESTMLRILLRGVAVSLPAILTIVIAIWVANFVNIYILQPASISVQYLIAQLVDESQPTNSLFHIEAAPPIESCDTSYRVNEELRKKYARLIAGEQGATNQTSWSVQRERRSEWMQIQADIPGQIYVPLGPRAVPYSVYSTVARNMPPGQTPGSVTGVYMEFVALRYFGSAFLLSAITVSLLIILLYFLGRFVSVRIGGWIVYQVETQLLGRLPVIRNIYGSVKQVTDFVFTENENVSYRGVAAVQYPRKGIWTIGFVTGESMLDIAMAAGEKCVAVLIPTSPMPMTGFTINVPESEVLEIDITVEQAMQFCISCGVLTPPHQKLSKALQKQLIREGKLTAPGSNASNGSHDAISNPMV